MRVVVTDGPEAANRMRGTHLNEHFGGSFKLMKPNNLDVSGYRVYYLFHYSEFVRSQFKDVFVHKVLADKR